ncbi:MAG: exosome complex RNA-binding protein Csl4 [Methanobacteriaceae archaeon]|jgi:exosome complex component CSL4|nr:exosome complex RNA-binding protein Csl4 [Candidatus Methanorudis spinitermitis]
MKINSSDFVMPGDVLGVSEQFLPDEWTYDDGNCIKAAVFGNVSIDNKRKRISIIPKSGTPTLLKIGDTVYGQVSDVRGQRAVIDVQGMKDCDRQLALSYMGAIHISQVKNGYLEKLHDAFRIGDIIEAKVAKIMGDNLDLNTIDKEGGIIKAMCTKCRAFMRQTNKKDELYCEVCNRKEKRKISSNYNY